MTICHITTDERAELKAVMRRIDNEIRAGVREHPYNWLGRILPDKYLARLALAEITGEKGCIWPHNRPFAPIKGRVRVGGDEAAERRSEVACRAGCGEYDVEDAVRGNV